MNIFLTIFYDLSLLALMLIFFPKLLWKSIFQKKYRKSFFSRIQGKAPYPHSSGPVIWFHAVSIGECKALSTLVPSVRQDHPDAFILISTVTETGQKEAKRSIPEADAFSYLPIDFSCVVRHFVKRLQPTLLILVEGDFWYNLLKEVKKIGGSIVVVNGKISEKSLKRYFFLKSFSQALFETIDFFCVQSEEYLSRFLKLGIDPDKMIVMGNLKYDISNFDISEKSKQLWKEKLGLQTKDMVLTVGSTHEKEEELLLRALKPLWNKYEHLRILLVPRHPERFQKVGNMIKEDGTTYVNYSSLLLKKQGNKKIILIDEMGMLSHCYSVSDLSIVGGSFIEGIGGHNVFEPAKMGIPVFFGPYMHKQLDLSKTLIQSGVGKQVSIEALTDLLEEYLSTPSLMIEDGKKGKYLAQKMGGTASKTWKQIKRYVTSS